MAFDAGAVVARATLNTRQFDSGLKSMQSGVSKFAGIAKVGFAAAGAALAAGIVKSVGAADNFEKSLANVSTVVDTSKVNMDALRKQIMNMNPALGSAKDLTDGLYQAFSAGAPNAKAALELTATSAKFAKAALTDTNTAVDILSTAMNAYGHEVMSAKKASDLYFTTIKQGKITGQQLSSVIGQSISIFASAGIQMEELNAGIAALTKMGVQAEETTTGLNAVVSSFLKPTQELSEALASLGYESGAAFLEAEGLKGAFELLEVQSGGNADALAAMLPNIRALKTAMALTGEGGEEFIEILDDMYNAAGATDEAFEKQRLTIETFQNQLNKTSIAIGSTMLDAFDDATGGATDFLKKIQDIFTEEENVESLKTVFKGLSKFILDAAVGASELLTSLVQMFNLEHDREDLPGPIRLLDQIRTLVGGKGGILFGGARANNIVEAIKKLFAESPTMQMGDFLAGAAQAEQTLNDMNDTAVLRQEQLMDRLAANREKAKKDINKKKNEDDKKKKNIEEIVFSTHRLGDAIDAASNRWKFFNDGADEASDKIEGLENVSKKVKLTPQEIAEGFKAANAVIQTTINSFKSLDGTASSVIGAMTDIGSTIASAIPGPAGQAASAVISMVGGIIEGITEAVEGFPKLLGKIRRESENIQMRLTERKLDYEEKRLKKIDEDRKKRLDEQLKTGQISSLKHAKELKQIEKESEQRKLEFERQRFEIQKRRDEMEIQVMILENKAELARFPLRIVQREIREAIMAQGRALSDSLHFIRGEQFIGGMQSGGIMDYTGLARINEQGGELVRLPGGATVIPSDISRDIAMAGGTKRQPQVINHININYPTLLNEEAVEELSDQISRSIDTRMSRQIV